LQTSAASDGRGYNLIPSEEASPVRTEVFSGSFSVSQRSPRTSLRMTSQVRVRRVSLAWSESWV